MISWTRSSRWSSSSATATEAAAGTGKLHLIRSAYDALPEGGALVVIESLIDDARPEIAFGLMMSLNMLIEFGDAFDFTGADFAG